MSRTARRYLGAAIAVLTLALLTAAAVRLARPERHGDLAARLEVAAALSGQAVEGYARAFEPRSFSFPADHGPHPAFRTEWWYFTGNLDAAGGRRFGYQLTFFRSALAPDPPARDSAWATRDAWLAHFALTDTAAESFRSFERWSRGALGLAGARVEPLRVWVEGWSAEAVEPGAPFPARLRAAAEGVAVDLVVEQGKPPVLQGERGLSRKSAEPGNASYYYSLTRMPTRGTVTSGGERFGVSGLSWMDREWSTSALGPDQVGWDWFALQLEDGRDIMLYRLRRRDGTIDPASSGTFVEPDGASRTLAPEEVVLEVLDRWPSPRSGASYPARWRLRVPAARIDLEIRPVLADQELDVSFRYWEGAVDVEGESGGRPVRGRGYVEMTGYAEAAPAER